MTTIEERMARNEAQIEEIRAHFATKADLRRVMLTVVSAQVAMLCLAVGIILLFG